MGALGHSSPEYKKMADILDTIASYAWSGAAVVLALLDNGIVGGAPPVVLAALAIGVTACTFVLFGLVLIAAERWGTGSRG